MTSLRVSDGDTRSQKHMYTKARQLLADVLNRDDAEQMPSDINYK
jgi:hypothetical protein